MTLTLFSAYTLLHGAHRLYLHYYYYLSHRIVMIRDETHEFEEILPIEMCIPSYICIAILYMKKLQNH